MGNQNFCHCIHINQNDKTVKINIDEYIEENDAFYNELSKSNFTIIKNDNYEIKSSSTKNINFLNYKLNFEKRSFSFQDPDLSFVTIHMKPSKTNKNL